MYGLVSEKVALKYVVIVGFIMSTTRGYLISVTTINTFVQLMPQPIRNATKQIMRKQDHDLEVECHQNLNIQQNETDALGPPGWGRHARCFENEYELMQGTNPKRRGLAHRQDLTAELMQQ